MKGLVSYRLNYLKINSNPENVNIILNLLFNYF